MTKKNDANNDLSSITQETSNYSTIHAVLFPNIHEASRARSKTNTWSHGREIPYPEIEEKDQFLHNILFPKGDEYAFQLT